MPDRKPPDGRWLQLGGHCDGNHDVLSVAIREAQEESGVQNIASWLPSIFDIDIHLIPANKNEGEHYHYDVRFLLCITSDESVTQSHESNELLWIGTDFRELPTEELSMIRMFNKWKQTLLGE